MWPLWFELRSCCMVKNQPWELWSPRSTDILFDRQISFPLSALILALYNNYFEQVMDRGTMYVHPEYTQIMLYERLRHTLTSFILSNYMYVRSLVCCWHSSYIYVANPGCNVRHSLSNKTTFCTHLYITTYKQHQQQCQQQIHVHMYKHVLARPRSLKLPR